MSSEFGETGERIAATSSDEHGQDRGLAWRRTDQTSISSAPNSSNAPRIPDKEWEEHKYRIYEMYVLKNMPLSQVKEGLKREREFIATYVLPSTSDPLKAGTNQPREELGNTFTNFKGGEYRNTTRRVKGKKEYGTTPKTRTACKTQANLSKNLPYQLRTHHPYLHTDL